MNKRDNASSQPIHSNPLGMRMLVGAGIGLVLISFFLLGAGEPEPEWSRYWMVKPLLVVPLAGAMGGLFYHLMDYLRYEGGWRRVLANVLSLLVLFLVLWLGIVLGLHGTMWD
ncbi:hypothetical protein [Pontibacter roseus]|uniref:hypothetical protein n=1 Tax=Pontibacter roseus TaxID=336989 RepID=UPI000475BE7D|nr:hypothetical protein [Pontibacter roseus]